MPKAKNPVTPVPLSPKLRGQLYASADKLGRKLTVHITMLLQKAMDEERAR